MKLTLRDVLNWVFRYWRALVTLWAVILVAAVVFYGQTEKLYTSKAKILVSMGPEALGKAEYLNGKNMQLFQREQDIHNEQQILESHEVMLTAAKWIAGASAPGSPAPVEDSQIREAKHSFLSQPPPSLVGRIAAVAGKALGDEHPAKPGEELENIAKKLSAHLTVKAIYDSDALELTFRDRDPRVAQTILKLLIAAYLQHHIAVFQSNAEADLIKSQLDSSVGKYQDRLGKFSSFMTAHKVYNDDTQVTVLIEQREKLKQELDEAQANNEAASARLVSLRGIQESLQQFERYSTTESRNSQREALMAKIDDATVEERALLSRHPKGSRAYDEAESKLAELRRLLEQEPAQVVKETEQRRSKASEYVESEIISVSAAQRGEQARIESVRGDLQKVDSEMNTYATDLKDFNSLKLDLAFAKQESEQMAQVYVGSRLRALTSKSSITDISIIDMPSWDPGSASPSKRIAIAGTLMLLIMGSCALLVACKWLDTTMADAATAEVQLGALVTGALPLTRARVDAEDFPNFFTQENQREFDRIYQSLRKLGPEGKVIVLTESTPQEGASLVGYGLARFLSRHAHEKTAFIDRTAHPIVESSIFGDELANQQAVVAWPENALDGGNSPGGQDAASVLSKLRQQFAYVVVAACAVKDSTDLLLISGTVSTVFLIVEANKTRRPAALNSMNLLRRYGFDDIRLILNKRVYHIPGWLMRFI